MKEKNQGVSFRLSQENYDKLQYICDVCECSQTVLLTTAIEREYDKLHGNKQVLSMIEKMKIARKALERLNADLDKLKP